MRYELFTNISTEPATKEENILPGNHPKLPTGVEKP
jgi:hypothetical protein